MVEWLMTAVLKTVCCNRHEGSNPSLSVYAGMSEMADELDLKSKVHYERVGSSPTARTLKNKFNI